MCDIGKYLSIQAKATQNILSNAQNAITKLELINKSNEQYDKKCALKEQIYKERG